MSNLQNPRTKFEYNDFPGQQQDGPALQSEMTPVPDTGEETYTGHGRMKGLKALNTGGDSGIGRAAAIAYAKEGADVAIQYLPGEEKDAKEVEDFINNLGQKAVTLKANFRNDGEAAKVVRDAVEALGGLDVLVLNSAEQFAQEKIEDLSVEQFKNTFQVNVISMFEAVKEAEKHLESGASIILTTSVESFNPSKQLLDYAATKGAISNLVVNLSQHFNEKGIRVNGVAPGPIWTPLQLDGGQLEGKIPTFGQGSLLGRAGQPVELASVYVLLGSEESSYTTGQIYGITGGYNISL